jgi:soluble lytic murein transglycosylase-like protein
MQAGRVALATGILLCATGCGRQVPVIPAPRPAVERTATKPIPAAAQPVKPKPTLPAKPPAAATKPVVVAAKPAKPPAKVSAKRSAKPVPKAKPVPVDSLKLEQDLIDQWEHAPLAYVLSHRSGNPEVADRAAAAVLYEAQRLNLSVSFIAAVLLVENTPMDSSAESVAGAIGLMQVMPMHSGGWGCPSDELQEIEANICHGTRLLHMLIRRSRTTAMALRRYNGCLGARVTRSCLRYPARVLRTAGRIRKEMLLAPIDSFPTEPEEPSSPPPFYLRRLSFAGDSVPIELSVTDFPSFNSPSRFRR